MVVGTAFDRVDYIYAANATVMASDIVGEANNPIVALSVTPLPAVHRAVVSTFTVTPITAPALIKVEPRLVTKGDTFLVRVNSPDRADWGGYHRAAQRQVRHRCTDRCGRHRQLLAVQLQILHLRLAPGAYDAVTLAPTAQN